MEEWANGARFGRGVNELPNMDGPRRGRCIARKISTIIQSFAGRPEQSMTEIAQFAGLPLSTTHRLVGQMAECGLVERGENGRYHVGALLGQSARSWSAPV